MEFIVDNSSSGTNSNIITGLSDNIVYNSTLLSSSNNLQSNILNTSNYASNISNIITTRDGVNLTASSNYSLNISNALKTNIDANNTATNTAIGNTSNYSLNISNIITTRDGVNLTASSNYSLNISNALKTNIDANNTATNTAIGNTSNYSLNISNIITTRDVVNLTASSNYSLNISNALKTNIDANNTATNTAIGNTSNYSLNISNIITTRDALNLTASSNYSLNISNALKTNIDANNTATNTAIGNTSNYSLNISNILTTRDALNLTASSNYSLNISNVLKTNIDANNTATNTAIGNTSNYSLNISNIITTRDGVNLTASSNYSLNISNALKTNIDANNTATNTAIGNTSNYSLNISNILLYNITNIVDTFLYTSERPYPPKTYNLSTNETTITFLSKTVYTQTITLNADNISYGNGDYIIYSSSVYTVGDQTQLRKRDLFNYIIEETGGHWDSSYNASGDYISLTSNNIKNDYNGDWIIIKLPKAIILTKFKFVHRTSYVSQAPSLWRCYGSNDGIIFTEITEAFNDVVANALTSSSYINKIYEKVLNTSFKTSYQYIGFTFNKTVANQYLCFTELQLFGREIYNFQSELAAIALGTNISNYASNISNIIIANNSNFTLGTSANSSNYSLNISNIITTRDALNLTASSNYSLNISNALKTNIDANNTATNTAIGNTSNYSLNISNIITTRDGVNLTASSNYSLNISNALKTNIDANNANIINNYLPLAGGTMTGTLYVNSNIQTQQLYINNSTSTASIFFSPNYSVYSIFSRKVPWAMYFAEDYNASSPTVLPNYISNGRDATLSGTAVTKTSLAGNGSLGAITFISGITTSLLSFPVGSIPATFTILGLMRYTNSSANQGRILTSSSGNWLLGYNTTAEGTGIAFFNAWKTLQNLTVLTTKTDWLCMIAKNIGATPNNIIANGTGYGNDTGGDGGGSYRLGINNDIHGSVTRSDWALSCVMIWDTPLTDAEMFDLNTIINTYKNDGISIKTLISSTIDDDSIIESRVYSGVEKTELLLFKGNDGTGTNGSDRIRLKAGNIAFDTYSTLTPSSSRNTENIVMFINENGNIGIGTTTNLSYKLNVNGSINSTSFAQNGTLIDFTSYATNTAIGNTSNYTTNVSNILLTAISLGTNTSNYALNISNILTSRDALNLTASSNYSLNISNVLKANIDANNTATNTAIGNTSNYTTNVSNILLTAISLGTNTSNYALNISNILTSRDALNLTASSNYSLNISNVLKANIDANNTSIINNYLPLSGGDLTGNLNIKTGTSIIHFGTRLIDNLLTLWSDGTSTYGIGINNTTLRYNVPASTSHRFYTGTTNTVTIDGSGNVGIGITNPFASLCIGTPLATSDGTLVLSKKAVTGNRNFKFGYDTNFNFCMGDFGPDALTTSPWTSNQLSINWNNGNVGIGITPQSQKLYVNGATTVNGAITATSFSGDGANITNVPYSTITGKPSTFPVDTAIYYNKTEVNTAIGNTSNYTTNVSNILLTAISSGTSVNSSNYTLNISNILTSRDALNLTASSNYSLNISNALKTFIDTKDAILSFTSPLIRTVNSITFSESSITTLTNFYNKTDSDARYLQLSGGTLTNILDISTSTADNQLRITTTASTNYASIRFKNNSTNYGFIGIAATAVSGYYTNNLFLEATNAIVFNSGGNTTASANSPVMILNSSGNLGIGTTNPNYKLHLRGSNPTLLRIETNTNDVNQVSGIEFGIPAFASAGSAKITSTTSAGDIADLKFHTSASTNSSSAKMTIRGDGNIGISNTNPSQILQVGNAGRLRISNGTTDYSLLGTIDTDGALNTRIVISGNTRSAPYTGNIEYVATSSGSHIFYTTNSETERMRINSNGIITTSSNIDCGGGIAITGANAFFTPGGIITGDNGVDSNNLTNTYINFKNAGASGDWCYIRQIGTSEAYKLALDFHDDNNDARFCIRNVQSSVAGGVDVVREVFTVDNGNVGIGTNIPLQKLHIDTGCLFITNNVSNPGTVSSASLWNQAGIGPTISGLQFVVQTNGTTERLRIDNNGLLTTTGNIDCGGGLTITGSTAFHNASAVDSNNLTNTYINFKGAGAGSDWCYIRQIGGNEAYKLALDFHDDANDARFCIRNIHSSLASDTVTEVFTVDNGNVTCTGSMFITNTANPYVQFGSVNGHNLGVATGAGGLSSSAATGDMVLRTINNLYLQSGTGGHALKIDTANNITSTGTLTSPVINLTTSGTGNNVLYIKSTLTTANNCIQFQNNLNKTVYMGIGGSAFTGNYENNFFIESSHGSIILNSQGKGSASNPSMIIHSSGNIGIGTNNPQTELELYDTTNPKIYLNHNGTSRYFISGTSTSIDIGSDNGASKTIRFMPDNTERMIINSSGNVGIGTNNPNLNLQIGSTNANHNIGRAILTAGNIHDADKRDFLSIGRWDGASTADWQFTGLKYGVITGAASGEGADNHSCITFHTWGNSISNSREVMRINSRGVLSILNNLIYNYLFNNTGFNHATINSFDSITEFGYRFIQGTTGGPGTHGSVAQYYQWSIGLGIDFAYSNYVCQFALPRNIANPVLSVRFKENGTWGSWSGITAEALTSGNKSITGNLNVSGNVGIGTATSTTKLHIDHTSTTFNAANGGLYLINSNNVANNCSVIGASIGGSTASKAGLSLNVNGNYGWSMYINGFDTTDKTLRFNSSGDSSGTERLQIRGSDGYTIFTGNMHVASTTGSGSLIIGNSQSAVSLTLTDIATAVWKIETGNTNLTFSNDSPTGGTFISKMIITSDGNLLVRGDISAFANMSDRRLKHNINDLSINCIDLLNNIKPVEFIWNDMDEIINIKRNTYDHGFIAQDIELLLPNLVNQYEKYKSIKYEKLTPYLVKGSQELYKLIQDLQADNIRQQKQINDLQNQINMIKSQLSQLS